MSRWIMYVVRCSDGTLYTGITTDISRRLLEHNYGMKGSKYTRSRRPVALVHTEDFEDRSEASKREWAFKKLSKVKKERLVGDTQNK
mgnify:CR=1 FL=1